MKTTTTCAFSVLFAALSLNVFATIRYVDLNNVTPLTPYTNWTSAATTIQSAIDVAIAGDVVMVKDGIYRTGGRAVYGTATNRVVVNKAITIQSLNGPGSTVIEGSGTNSPVRGVYLASGATLSGFTVTNGSTLIGTGDPVFEQSGGGIWCESSNAMVLNCLLSGNYAFSFGGGVYQGTLLDCFLTNNFAIQGGGMYLGTLSNCLVVANSAATRGGGACTSLVDHCTFSNNVVVGGFFAGDGGGAIYGGSVINSLISSNYAKTQGGGISSASITNCVIRNSFSYFGGGVVRGTANNCLITGNSASLYPSAAYSSFLRNCTVVGNSNSSPYGVAVYVSDITSCIVYDNPGGFGNISNFSETVAFSCTTSLNIEGPGNFTNAPLFIDPANGDFRLRPNSPCINAGYNPAVTASFDLDGNPRISGGTVDVGAYEVQSPGSTLSYVWAQRFGFPTDGSADFIDTDGDGAKNADEWLAGTDPTNSFSLLKINGITNSPSGVLVNWQSVTGAVYTLQRSIDLGAQPAFSIVASNLTGNASNTTFLDTNAVGAEPSFYRVSVP